MNRPSNTDKCGQSQCKHDFAKHFTTYDGAQHGCVVETDNQLNTPSKCYCTGFAVIRTWNPEGEQTSYINSIGNLP